MTEVSKIFTKADLDQYLVMYRNVNDIFKIVFREYICGLGSTHVAYIQGCKRAESYVDSLTADDVDVLSCCKMTL